MELGRLAAAGCGLLRTVGILSQASELGAINYCNAADGSIEPALQLALQRGRPILAVFAEFPG